MAENMDLKNVAKNVKHNKMDRENLFKLRRSYDGKNEQEESD